MAFFQESRSGREPLFRAPAVVFWLIAALVVAHLGRVLAPESFSNAVLVNYSFMPARYSQQFLAAHNLNPGSWLEQALPFVGYIFIHADVTHLAVNCLWLLAFGPIVARRYGGFAFLAFFFICGIAAAAVHLACNWGSADPVIGASGAISGLMAAGIRLLPTLRRPGGPMAPILSAQVLLFSLFWVIVNLIAAKTGFGTAGDMHLVAWQAHLGGYFVGLFLAGPFDALKGLRTRESPAHP